MRGKRVGSTQYTARHLASGRRTTRGGNHTWAEELALLKLVFCGIFFVLLVALKLLFPETAENLAQSASLLIGRDADFVEAFAAMGRAVSGEESVGDSLKGAYTSVFNPSMKETEVVEGEDQLEKSNEGEDSVTKVLLYNGVSPSPTKMTACELGEVSEKTIVKEWVSYIVPSIPENASLEQRNLGFSYTTPVCGTLTSSFGWREHPVAGDSRFHYGLDLAAEAGTDICAFADGQVYATGESSTLGKYIILSHAQGYKTLYAHCSTVSKLNGNVSMGEVIAKVGESGMATGPHLHFELQKGTLYLNPIYYVDLG